MLRQEARALGRTADRLWVVPMYGSLPAREQLAAFDSAPHGTRKVVVATNIAEASITIPGVVYVVDCGFVKLRALNGRNGIESLMLLPISQVSSLPIAQVPRPRPSNVPGGRDGSGRASATDCIRNRRWGNCSRARCPRCNDVISRR
jgi:hypothetical protein